MEGEVTATHLFAELLFLVVPVTIILAGYPKEPFFDNRNLGIIGT